MAAEIVEPVDLCLPGGRLNPDAAGWTRKPLHRSNLRGWGRCKRWEYWGIITPTHIMGLVVSSIDYLGIHGVYVLDRESGDEYVKDASTPLAAGVLMPDRSGVGLARASGGDLTIAIDQRPSGSAIHAEALDFRLDVEITQPDGHESMGLVAAWSDRRFQYTVKDLGRSVRGVLRIDGRTIDIDPAESFAVLDHGRGKWPYSISWNWGAGCAPGRAIQLGGQWTDGTNTTENALFVDGVLHKIDEAVQWEYDRSNWLAPWHISGPRVDVVFTPFHLRTSRTWIGVLGNDTHQCFGHYSGRAQTDDGAWVQLEDLTGWAEDVRNRW